MTNLLVALALKTNNRRVHLLFAIGTIAWLCSPAAQLVFVPLGFWWLGWVTS
jgi:hypothetical protein